MRVEIVNLREFADNEFGGKPVYRTQLEVLSDLRTYVESREDLPTTAPIEYKDGGFALFDLVRYDAMTGIAYYQYFTTAS